MSLFCRRISERRTSEAPFSQPLTVCKDGQHESKVGKPTYSFKSCCLFPSVVTEMRAGDVCACSSSSCVFHWSEHVSCMIQGWSSWWRLMYHIWWMHSYLLELNLQFCEENQLQQFFFPSGVLTGGGQVQRVVNPPRIDPPPQGSTSTSRAFPPHLSLQGQQYSGSDDGSWKASRCHAAKGSTSPSLPPCDPPILNKKPFTHSLPWCQRRPRRLLSGALDSVFITFND